MSNQNTAFSHISKQPVYVQGEVTQQFSTSQSSPLCMRLWQTASVCVCVCICLCACAHVHSHSCIWEKIQPRVKLNLMTQTSVSRAVWCIRSKMSTDWNANLGSVINQLHWPLTTRQRSLSLCFLV